MGFTDRKLEMSILGLSVVLLAGMGYLLKSPVQAVLADADVIYEMPRPKNSILAALFDLGDRDVSRKYVNPFAKKKEEAKKTAEAKKPAAPAAAKKTAQNNKDKSKDEARKKKVDIKVVEADPQNTLGDDGSTGGRRQAASPYNGAGAGNENGTAAKGDAEDKNTLSPDQWRSLLAAQPTKENVAKLIAAYSAKEIDDQAFYTIVADLLRSNKAETQALGLIAAKSTYNAQSFSVIAKYYDQLPADLQTQAHAYLLTYAVTPRLGLLASALRSSDVAVVEAATEVVMEGYRKAKEGGVTVPASDPRTSRGDVFTNSVASYAQFVPIFQQLAQSEDPTIRALASSALSQIQTSAVASL